MGVCQASGNTALKSQVPLRPETSLSTPSPSSTLSLHSSCPSLTHSYTETLVLFPLLPPLPPLLSSHLHQEQQALARNAQHPLLTHGHCRCAMRIRCPSLPLPLPARTPCSTPCCCCCCVGWVRVCVGHHHGIVLHWQWQQQVGVKGEVQQNVEAAGTHGGTARGKHALERRRGVGRGRGINREGKAGVREEEQRGKG